MKKLTNKEELIKRLKSLGWHLGTMVLAVCIDWLINNLGLFNMPGEVTVVLGLVLGQISKYLNTK